ncbi:MAG: hypothetical protein PHY92_08955 [Alphaproteobacteria bacterium]|nr:hypothetical protein [Alphaproteobacteria bacterium]
MGKNLGLSRAAAGLTLLLVSVFLCSAAEANDAVVLKYSGGKLVFAGVAENIQFTPDQGFLSVDSQIFAFRDKCSGLFMRVADDFIIELSKEPVNCGDLPKTQN